MPTDLQLIRAVEKATTGATVLGLFSLLSAYKRAMADVDNGVTSRYLSECTPYNQRVWPWCAGCTPQEVLKAVESALQSILSGASLTVAMISFRKEIALMAKRG
jgi:hypothetical protein